MFIIPCFIFQFFETENKWKHFSQVSHHSLFEKLNGGQYFTITDSVCLSNVIIVRQDLQAAGMKAAWDLSYSLSTISPCCNLPLIRGNQIEYSKEWWSHGMLNDHEEAVRVRSTDRNSGRQV
jgi:hypothetical protein